jgi:hypothetical protein
VTDDTYGAVDDDAWVCPFGTPEFPWHYEDEEWPESCGGCGTVLETVLPQ